jgi:hypothetical protein
MKQELLQESQGPTAIFGCSVCFATGQTITTSSGKRKFVFPCNCDVMLRTKEGAIECASTALSNDVPAILGIKGHAVLATLTTFDYIEDFVIDPMHCLWLHVVFMFLTMWLSNDNKVSLQLDVSAHLDNCAHNRTNSGACIITATRSTPGC